MTRYLTTSEIMAVHGRVMAQSGGLVGLRDLAALESAAAQPQATFDGTELYPSLVKKAAAIGFSLIQNHPFIDGNKRIGHAVMEIFLILNGHEIVANIDDQEQLILGVASSAITRAELADWIQNHLKAR